MNDGLATPVDDGTETIHSYEAYLEKFGSLTYRNKGTSMLPMLKEGRDLFTVVSKTEARCQKYDVVLYRRPPHSYVLHRIIEVREKDYVILGDNCIQKEYGITDADILAVLTSFVRKGKEYHVEDFDYRLYARAWVWCSPIRIFIKKSAVFLRRWLRNLKKR